VAPWRCPECGQVMERPGRPHEPCFRPLSFTVWVADGGLSEVLDAMRRAGLEVTCVADPRE
jgi:hypothetical protein